MRKRGVRQAADIDHIGAVGTVSRRARECVVDRAERGIHEFGEYQHVAAVEFARRALHAEKSRQVFQFLGATFERDPEMRRQCLCIPAAAPG